MRSCIHGASAPVVCPSACGARRCVAASPGNCLRGSSSAPAAVNGACKPLCSSPTSISARPRRRPCGSAAISTHSAAASGAPAAPAAAVAAAEELGVRLVTPSCDPAVTRRVVETLGEGFRDDPLLDMLGVRDDRRPQFFRMFAVFLRKWPKEHVLYVADGGDAVALVVDSERLKSTEIGLLDMLLSGVLLELLLMPWSSLPLFFEMMEQMDESHLALEPHGASGRYLKVIALATHPDARGRGLGGRLMEAISRRVDAEGVPAFLEAAPTGVDEYYRDRHGYERVGALRMEFPPRGGFEVPLMLRKPGGSDGGGRR